VGTKTQQYHELFRDLRWPLAIAGVCSAISIVLVEEPKSDIAAYYGPLTQAFIDGRYSRAFFHMISPLVPTLAGIIGKMGFHSFTALKIVSCAFYVAALLPLRSLLGRAFDRRTVQIGCLLYSIHPRVMRYGTIGLFDSAKTFCLLLAAERLLCWHRDRRPAALVQAGVACAALTLARGEGIFLAGLAAAAVPVLSIIQHVTTPTEKRSTWAAGLVRAAGNALVVPAIVVALTMPWMLYEYRQTQFAVPCSMLINALPKVGIQTPGMKSHTDVIENGVSLGEENPADVVTPLRNFIETGKAIGVPYLVLLLLGLYWRIASDLRHRRGTLEEFTLEMTTCAVFCLNLVMFLVNGAITKRYVTPTVPFLLVWCARGARELLDWGERQEGKLRQVAQLAVAVFVVTSVGDGLLKVRSSLYRRDIVREIAEWVAEHRAELDVCTAPPLESVPGTYVYHSGLQPVIAGAHVQRITYFAKADAVLIGGKVRFPYDSLVQHFRDKHVDIFARDPDFTRQCPEFDAVNRHFELINDTWAAWDILIYRFNSREGTPGNP